MLKMSGGDLSEHRERTREAFFVTLSGLITAKDFDAVGTSDLANKSGTSRMAIYNHFSDREELLLAYIEFGANAYVDRINSELTRTDSPLNRLRIYAHEQMPARRGYLLSPRAPLRDVASKETAVALRKHAFVTGRLFRRILGKCIEASAIPNQNLDVTVQFLQGALTGRRVPKDEPARSAFLDAADRLVLHSAEASVSDDLASLSS